MGRHSRSGRSISDRCIALTVLIVTAVGVTVTVLQLILGVMTFEVSRHPAIVVSSSPQASPGSGGTATSPVGTARP
jgi:hypothetical protein